MNPYTLNPLLKEKTPTIDVQGAVDSALAGNRTPAQSTPTPGAFQYADGGQATMAPTAAPTIPAAPAVTPTASPTIGETLGTTPTIGDTLNRIKTEALGIQDQIKNLKAKEAGLGTPSYETGPSFEQLYPTINEDLVRRNQQKLFQKEIDATNQIYDEILRNERLAGQGRIGSQTAISARSGLLGSDFGEAQRSNVVAANLSAERGIQAERNAKIGEILGKVRSAVTAELAEKRAARQQGAQNYINFLASERDRKDRNVATAAAAILSSGLDPKDLTTEELTALGKEAGISAQDILSKYNELKSASEASALEGTKTQAEIDKINADIAKGKLITIGEGTTLYNTETGETFKNPKTYAPGTGSSSSSAVALTTEDKRTLLGGGWTQADIAALESGVREYGLQEVIDNEKAAGASDAQINALRNAYGAKEGTAGSVFNRQYLSEIYQIPDNEESSSFLGFEYGDTNKEKLDALESRIKVWQSAGFTDKDILKALGLDQVSS